MVMLLAILGQVIYGKVCAPKIKNRNMRGVSSDSSPHKSRCEPAGASALRRSLWPRLPAGPVAQPPGAGKSKREPLTLEELTAPRTHHFRREDSHSPRAPLKRAPKPLSHATRRASTSQPPPQSSTAHAATMSAAAVTPTAVDVASLPVL